MKRKTRKKWALIGVFVFVTCVFVRHYQERRQFISGQVLAADAEYKWYRGNLHTHTLWSDGDEFPENVAQWYKDHGYDFLSFTDHNTLLRKERWVDLDDRDGAKIGLEKLRNRFPEDWIEIRNSDQEIRQIRLKTFQEIAARLEKPGQFLLIEGEEISDEYGGIPIHMNVTNIAETIPPMKGDDFYEVMQRNTTAALIQRKKTGRAMIIHLNHPNFFYAITAEDLARVRGENLFEVYNGHPDVRNEGDDLHASAERIWDVVLTLRTTSLRLPLMFGLATDDAHHYHQRPGRNSRPGRGWIEVLAKDLNQDEIVRSIETGMFYASTGVKLSRVFASKESIRISITAQPGVDFRIDFIGTRLGFDKQVEPIEDLQGKELRTTSRYSNDVGRVLKTIEGAEGEYAFEPTDLYVRARITSSKKHPDPSAPGEYERAWCQPVRGPAGRNLR